MRTSLLTSKSTEAHGDPVGVGVGPQIPILLLARTLSTGDISRREASIDHVRLPRSPKVTISRDKGKGKEMENIREDLVEKTRKRKKKKLSRLLLRSNLVSTFEEETAVMTSFSSSPNRNIESTPKDSRPHSEDPEPDILVTLLPDFDLSSDGEAIENTEINLIDSARLKYCFDDRGSHMNAPRQVEARCNLTPETMTLSQPKDKSGTSTSSAGSSLTTTITTAMATAPPRSLSSDRRPDNCSSQRANEGPMIVTTKPHEIGDIPDLDNDESLVGYEELYNDEEHVHGQEAKVNKRTWKLLAKNLKPKYIALKLDLTDVKHNDVGTKKSNPRNSNPPRKSSRPQISPVIPTLSPDELGKVNAFYAPLPSQYTPCLPPKDYLPLQDTVLDISRLNIRDDSEHDRSLSVPLSPLSPISLVSSDFYSSAEEHVSLSPTSDVHVFVHESEPLQPYLPPPNGPIYFTLDYSSQRDDVELVLLENSPLDNGRAIHCQDSLTVSPGWGTRQIRRKKHPSLPTRHKRQSDSSDCSRWFDEGREGDP